VFEISQCEKLLIALEGARSEPEQAHLGILCNASGASGYGTSGTSSTSGASGYFEKIQLIVENC